MNEYKDKIEKKDMIDRTIYVYKNDYGEWEYVFRVEGAIFGMRFSKDAEKNSREFAITLANRSLNLIDFLGLEEYLAKDNDFSIQNFPEWQKFEESEMKDYKVIDL